jgi:hypothetical protein
MTGREEAEVIRGVLLELTMRAQERDATRSSR